MAEKTEETLLQKLTREKLPTGESDADVVARVKAKTGMDLSPRSASDVATARAVEKAEKLSKPVQQE